MVHLPILLPGSAYITQLGTRNKNHPYHAKKEISDNLFNFLSSESAWKKDVRFRFKPDDLNLAFHESDFNRNQK